MGTKDCTMEHNGLQKRFLVFLFPQMSNLIITYFLLSRKLQGQGAECAKCLSCQE